MEVEVFESVNGVVNLYITDIVERVCAVVLLVEEGYRVLSGIRVLCERICFISESLTVTSPCEIAVEVFE